MLIEHQPRPAMLAPGPSRPRPQEAVWALGSSATGALLAVLALLTG